MLDTITPGNQPQKLHTATKSGRRGRSASTIHDTSSDPTEADSSSSRSSMTSNRDRHILKPNPPMVNIYCNNPGQTQRMLVYTRTSRKATSKPSHHSLLRAISTVVHTLLHSSRDGVTTPTTTIQSRPWRTGKPKSGQGCTKRRSNPKLWPGTMPFPHFRPIGRGRDLRRPIVRVLSTPGPRLAVVSIPRTDRTCLEVEVPTMPLRLKRTRDA